MISRNPILQSAKSVAPVATNAFTEAISRPINLAVHGFASENNLAKVRVRSMILGQLGLEADRKQLNIPEVLH